MTPATLAAPSLMRQLTDELESRLTELDKREAQLAAAYESLSQHAAVQSAFTEGTLHERSRILALIDHHLATLQRSGHNAIALGTLRRQITQPEIY